MIVVKRRLWYWALFLIGLTACAVVICAGLYLALQKQVDTNSALVGANRVLIEQNTNLIKQLQAEDAGKAVTLRQLRRSFQALRLQVQRLGGTPPPLPPLLQTPAAFDPEPSDGPSPRPASRAAVVPSPRPTRSSTPAPRSTPSSPGRPSASPTQTCIGPICLPP